MIKWDEVGDDMFDFKAFYDWMAKNMPDDCKVIEIGVADGISALYLATKLHELGKRFKLYMVDNLDYGGILQLKEIYENIIKSGLGQHIEVIPFGSLKASKLFNGNSIDFIFLDASHEYSETKKSIKNWFYKLNDGGYFGGHDYDLYPEVKKAVDETIPKFVTRDTLYDEDGGISQEFEPKQVLFNLETENNCGVFYCLKDFYIKLNK